MSARRLRIAGWRPALIAREALLSVRTSRRLRPLLLTAVVLGPALAGVAAADALALDRNRAILDEAGARVVVIAGSTEAPVSIDRASCEALSAMEGVERAGAVLPSVRSPVIPAGPAVALTPTSPTLVNELVWAEAVIGDELELRADRVKRLDTGEILAATAGSNQPEGIALDRAIAIRLPESVTTVERCIVVVDQGGDVTSIATFALGSLATSGSTPVATPVLTQPLDATAQYLDRPTRWIPLAAGALAGLATIALGATRLSEFAAYRLSGSRRRDLAAILGCEALALAGVAAASGVVAAVVVAPWIVSPAATAAGAISAAAVWWAIAAIGTAPLARISSLNLSKER